LPLVRLLQRLSMLLTMACCAYVFFFLFFNKNDCFNPPKGGIVIKRSIGLVSSSPKFDLKPYEASADVQARDIFSLGQAAGTSGAVENTPKGQLPDHLKVVGILIANPSQIIIEDNSANKTYFIDEGRPQAGIKIVRVNNNQMVINYQGQDISVPITQNGG